MIKLWKRKRVKWENFKVRCWNRQLWSPFGTFLLLKHSDMKQPSPPTAPVRSVYCLLSSQCDTHDSLLITTNSTRHVHRQDNRASERPIGGKLSGPPLQTKTLQETCRERRDKRKAITDWRRKRNKDGDWIIKEQLQLLTHYSAQCGSEELGRLLLSPPCCRPMI